MITSNRAGYVPGEMIGFNAEVDNLSNRNMKVAIIDGDIADKTKF